MLKRNFHHLLDAAEELLSGESRPAQLCRRYNIYSSVLYHWKKQ